MRHRRIETLVTSLIERLLAVVALGLAYKAIVTLHENHAVSPGWIAFAVAGVRPVHALRTRYVGSGAQVDLHIKVDGGLTVREGHDISEIVKQRLISDGPGVVDVVVHHEPHKA